MAVCSCCCAWALCQVALRQYLRASSSVQVGSVQMAQVALCKLLCASWSKGSPRQSLWGKVSPKPPPFFFDENRCSLWFAFKSGRGGGPEGRGWGGRLEREVERPQQPFWDQDLPSVFVFVCKAYHEKKWGPTCRTLTEGWTAGADKLLLGTGGAFQGRRVVGWRTRALVPCACRAQGCPWHMCWAIPGACR